MLPYLTLEQFYDWVAFYEVDPWGEERADMRNAALVASVLRPFSQDGIDPPSLMYPYFHDSCATPEELMEWMREFDALLERGEWPGKLFHESAYS